MSNISILNIKHSYERRMNADEKRKLIEMMSNLSTEISDDDLKKHIKETIGFELSAEDFQEILKLTNR